MKVKRMFAQVVLLGCILTPILSAAEQHPIAAIQDTETKAERDLQLGRWREARFCMFIHWGLYTEPVGTWNAKAVSVTCAMQKIPLADYKALAAKFDPEEFDADAWVKLAKDAGMRYIVITSKHHDGFAMFHSSTDKFNIYDATPFKRDSL